MHKSTKYFLVTLSLCAALTACTSKNDSKKEDKESKVQSESVSGSEAGTKKADVKVSDYLTTDLTASERYKVEIVSTEEKDGVLDVVARYTYLKDGMDAGEIPDSLHLFQNGISLQVEKEMGDSKTTSSVNANSGDYIEFRYTAELYDNTDVLMLVRNTDHSNLNEVMFADVYVNEERGVKPDTSLADEVKVDGVKSFEAKKDTSGKYYAYAEVECHNGTKGFAEKSDFEYSTDVFQNGVNLGDVDSERSNYAYNALVLPNYSCTFVSAYELLDDTDPVLKYVDFSKGYSKTETSFINSTSLGKKGLEADPSITEDSLKYTGFEKVTYDGDEYVVAYFELSCGSSDEISMDDMGSLSAKQGGVTVYSSMFFESEKEDVIDDSTNVLKGYTKKVYVPFKLKDKTADLELEFNPKSGSKVEAFTEVIKLQ